MQQTAAPPIFDRDRYIGRTEIRHKLGVSDEQLRAMERRADWPDAVAIGRRRKYLGAELLAWITSQKTHK